MQAVYRRRRRVAGLVVLAFAVAVLTAVRGELSDGGGSAPAGATDPATVELPGGGRELFPHRRIVSFYGAPQDEELGELGIGTPASAGRRLEEQAEPYATEDRPVLPAFELIATIAAAAPGGDGLYRIRQKPAVIREYLEAARAADALLVLDVQPGRADFMSEVRALEEFLEEPDVGLALDPEWHMGPEGVPGQSIGSVDAAEVNEVAAYLGRIVERGGLPEKLLLIHQFTDDMIVDREQLEAPPGVALTINVDGFGTPGLKRRKYHELVGEDGPAPPGRAANGPDEAQGKAAQGPAPLPVGFKLFYREDTRLMGPEQVLSLRPPPDVVVYE